MKSVKFILSVIAVILLPTFVYAANLGDARISFLEGDVQMRTADSGDWVAAAINTPLDEGDELWVPDGGRLEFQLHSGTVIRVDQGSALQILTLERTSSQFYLSEGHIYVDYNAPRGTVIQFDTPVSSLRAYDRAVFRVDVPDQYTDVSMFRGWLDAEGKDGKTRVNSGRTLTLGDDREAELALIGRPDNWQNWNVERDRKFASRGDSYRYLPDELRVYSMDLDDNGRWVRDKAYGSVWIPRAMAADWAPYRTGRWMWRGGDYVWISYEPWGWTPYHYGRWAFGPNIGWFWVPPPTRQVYWGPGYVGWVRTANQIAWVPLAPREIYYGYGNYGPQSVDLRKRDTRQINVTNITYQNVQVTNSVTVINNNSFVSGRREVAPTKENPFLTQKINLGRPDITPERGSFAPVVKTIEAAKLPPQQVTRLAVKELKQERRLVKEQGQSVINRGEPAKPMVVKAVEQPKSPTEKLQDRRQRGASAAPGESPRVKSEEKSASPVRPSETKETKGPVQSNPEPALKQPASASEKIPERQRQLEKAKSEKAMETPRAKAQEKAAIPSGASDSTETKTRTQSNPAPAVKQPERARDAVQERQPQEQKGKSEKAVESSEAKAEERVERPAKAESQQKQKGSEPKPEAAKESDSRKPVVFKEKAAAPSKAAVTIERKSTKQSGPDEKPAAVPAKAPEAKGESKSSKQAVAEKKESKEEKPAAKDGSEGKGKSDETKEEKIERRQKSRD